MADKDFGSWIISGDEWIVSYLSIHPELSFGIVTRFSISQALEHYFKACLVKKYDSEVAIKKGHDIYSMFLDLKQDAKFLPAINIEQHIYDSYSIKSGSFELLSFDVQSKILDLDYLLFPFKYSSDLKYPRFKKVKGQLVYGLGHFDNRYADIFHQIRTYLEWEKENNLDILKRAIGEDFISKDKYIKNRIDFLNICIKGKA